MKFSLFLEVQIASPTAASERQTFLDCVAQAVLADVLGYHCLWAVEHHGLFEYSHCSAPEVLLSFIAARTERVRLGHCGHAHPAPLQSSDPHRRARSPRSTSCPVAA